MAVEKAVYTVEKTDGDFQLRLYAPQVVAEVLVDGTLEEAGNTSNSTLETLPAPTDERVSLRTVLARRMAAVRYSGTWSRKRYERNLARLQEWVKTNGLVASGEPVWARYNPPFTPWFLRRNEILVPVATVGESGTQPKGALP